MKRKFSFYFVQYEKGKNYPGQFNIVCQNCGMNFTGISFHFADLLRNAKGHNCPDIISPMFEMELEKE